jgi:hypothetical protein
MRAVRVVWKPVALDTCRTLTSGKRVQMEPRLCSHGLNTTGYEGVGQTFDIANPHRQHRMVHADNDAVARSGRDSNSAPGNATWPVSIPVPFQGEDGSPAMATIEWYQHCRVGERHCVCQSTAAPSYGPRAVLCASFAAALAGTRSPRQRCAEGKQHSQLH